MALRGEFSTLRIAQWRGGHLFHHEVEGGDARLFAVGDADGYRTILGHHVVEHLVCQSLCCLQLLCDSVLLAESPYRRVHAQEVEVGTLDLEHLLADALDKGLGSTVDGLLEDLLGRAVLVDVAVLPFAAVPVLPCVPLPLVHGVVGRAQR